MLNHFIIEVYLLGAFFCVEKSYVTVPLKTRE